MDIVRSIINGGTKSVYRPQKMLENRNARVLTLASCKGGTGKSTLAEILASGLALLGYSVLLIEVEYNMRLMHTLTGRRQRGRALPISDETTACQLFTHPEMALGVKPIEVHYAEQVANAIPYLGKDRVDRLVAVRDWSHPATLHFIPGSTSLRGMDNKFFMATASDFAADFHQDVQFAKAVDALRPHYDFIINDTPPVTGLVQRNALAASDEIIIVGNFDTDAIEDIDRIDDFILDVAAGLKGLHREPPRVMGVVYNQFGNTDRDLKLYRAYTEPHPEEDEQGKPTGRTEPTWVDYPSLGTITFDRDTILAANDMRKSLHIQAPTSTIGNDAWQFVKLVEQALLVSASMIPVQPR